MDYIERLDEMHACEDALNFLRSAKYETPQAAWEASRRADWMAWLVVRGGGPQFKALLVTAFLDCMELILQYAGAAENASRETVKIARAWCFGESVTEDLEEAWNAVSEYVYGPSARIDRDTGAVVDCIRTLMYFIRDYSVHDCDCILREVGQVLDTKEGRAKGEGLALCADILRQHIPSPPSFSQMGADGGPHESE